MNKGLQAVGEFWQTGPTKGPFRPTSKKLL